MAAQESSQPMFTCKFDLTGGPGDASRDAQQSVLNAIESREFGASSQFAIRLALEEALSNAFKHGNQGDPSKVVRLECHIDDQQVRISIEDEGPGFDPRAVPDPTESENLEIPAGRGIVLMKSFMSKVEFNTPGNQVCMTFCRPDETSSTS